MNAGCSEVMADANSGGYVKQVNIAICTQIGVPVETFASRILAYGGIAMLSSSASPPSIHSARPRCARGHFLSFGRAHVHLNLVDDHTLCSEGSSARSPCAPLQCSEFSCSTGTSSTGSQGWWAVI